MFTELLDVDCECGRKHSLVTRDFAVEPNAMKKLPAMLEKLVIGQKPLAVYDDNTYRAAAQKVEANLPGVDSIILKPENPGELVIANEKQIEVVMQAMDGHSVLLAVGSGVINDVVRFVAHQEDISFISVPTAASADGFTANCAAVTLEGAKSTLPAVAPVGVVADLDIVAAAPMKLTAAGVGDLLSKYISTADWEIGHLLEGSYYCPYISQLSLNAAEMTVEKIDSIARREAEGISLLMEGLLMSGIAIQMAEITRPASSFEHHFSHFFEVVPTQNKTIGQALHGEKVGVASIIAVKYFPIFTRLLNRITDEGLENQFDMDKVLNDYYADSPRAVREFIKEENTPTITETLDKELLKKNFPKVLEIAESLPSPETLRTVLKKVGGYTDYREFDLTPEQFRRTMQICCYIRNRFTMLRMVCDYNLFDFDTMDD